MLKRIIDRLRAIQPSPLGRWCLKDKTKNDWKIDMANTDHCGPCSYGDLKHAPKTKTPASPVAPINKKT